MIILGLMEKMVQMKSSEISWTETDVQRILGLLPSQILFPCKKNPLGLTRSLDCTQNDNHLYIIFSALLKKFTIFIATFG